MRLQHGIAVALPGRGGRKRKAEESHVEDSSAGDVKSEDGISLTASQGEAPEIDAHSSDEEIPPSLVHLLDPDTGTILGRSKAMVRYIVMKAKYRYISAERDLLVEELEVLKREELRLESSKDKVLDKLLVAEIG